jgi:hypothetical protein
MKEQDWIGMCFMTPRCDLNEQITCHRYRATVPSKEAFTTGGAVQVIPERIVWWNKGNYRVYSSFFNGTIADGNKLM